MLWGKFDYGVADMDEMVNIDDLEITEEWTSEGDEIDYAVYNGVAFTGTAYKKTERLYSESQYLDGYEHGRYFSIYPNGQLSSEGYMEHGDMLTGTSWYPSGKIKSYYRKVMLMRPK